MLVNLAEGIALYLRTQAFAEGIDPAVRAWPRFRLEDLEDLKVTVSWLGMAEQLLTRGAASSGEYHVYVALQQKLPVDTAGAEERRAGELYGLAEAIKNRLKDRRVLPTVPGLVLSRILWPAAPDEQDAAAGVFSTTLTLVYRAGAGGA